MCADDDDHGSGLRSFSNSLINRTINFELKIMRWPMRRDAHHAIAICIRFVFIKLQYV